MSDRIVAMYMAGSCETFTADEVTEDNLVQAISGIGAPEQRPDAVAFAGLGRMGARWRGTLRGRVRGDGLEPHAAVALWPEPECGGANAAPDGRWGRRRHHHAGRRFASEAPSIMGVDGPFPAVARAGSWRWAP